MYQLFCISCDYEMPLLLGGGMNYPLEVTCENQAECGEDFENFFCEHPGGKIVLNENKLMRCVECGEFEVIGEGTMHFDYKKIPFKKRCNHCGGEFEHILSEKDCREAMEPPYGIKIIGMIKIILNMAGIISLANSKRLNGKMICPKCQGKLIVRWSGMWD